MLPRNWLWSGYESDIRVPEVPRLIRRSLLLHVKLSPVNFNWNFPFIKTLYWWKNYATNLIKNLYWFILASVFQDIIIFLLTLPGGCLDCHNMTELLSQKQTSTRQNKYRLLPVIFDWKLPLKIRLNKEKISVYILSFGKINIRFCQLIFDWKLPLKRRLNKEKYSGYILSGRKINICFC